MVVEDKDGVVNDVPEPRDAPPDAAAYQLIVPLETTADKSTVPVPQVAQSAFTVPVVGSTDSCPMLESPSPLRVATVQPS